MLVTVEGIIVKKRVGRTTLKTGGKVPFNFVVKDIVGDTAKVVYWDQPGEQLKINLVLLVGE